MNECHEMGVRAKFSRRTTDRKCSGQRSRLIEEQLPIITKPFIFIAFGK